MKKKKDEVQEDFVAELKSCFDDWEYMKLNGCDDPNWEDGANMNLVRNHIYYYKQKILEKFGKDNLPEIYFKEDPPEVEEEYMAKAELIKKLAPIRLAEFLPDRQHLWQHGLGQTLSFADGVARFLAAIDRAFDCPENRSTVRPNL